MASRRARHRPARYRPAPLGVIAAVAVVVSGVIAVRPAQVWSLERPSPEPTSAPPTFEARDAGGATAQVYVEDQEIGAADPDAAADAAAGVLPGDVPVSGPGDLLVAPGSTAAPGPGPVTTVRVEAEVGLPLDLEAFAEFVMEVLNDPRGWGADGSISFARTDGEADLRVVVASAGTVDAMCAPLRTNGMWSCGGYGHAALNATRWFTGADAFNEAGDGDLTAYRQYLVNHEVGHLLGHSHEGCPAAGALAPVMLQQSIDLRGCVPNGWPNP